MMNAECGMWTVECGMWNEEWVSGFWLLAVVDNRKPLLCFRRLRRLILRRRNRNDVFG